MPTLCSHGKTVCRFVDAQGRGCRWGDACHHCHHCERISGYDNLKKLLAGRRRGSAASSATAVGATSTQNLTGWTLPRLLGACPELIFEGALGQAVSSGSLAALFCTQRSTADLAAGSASACLWRSLLHRKAPGLSIEASLLASLPVPELRRCALALAPLRFKSAWRAESREELEAFASAAEKALDEAPESSSFFTFTCSFGGRGLWPPAGIEDTAWSESDGADGASDDDVGGEAAERVVFPAVAGEPIQKAGGAHFRVVPVMRGERLNGSRGWSWVLRPIATLAADSLPAENSAGPATPPARRDVDYEAYVWSASPRVCAFDGLGLHEERACTGDEAAALLGGHRASRAQRHTGSALRIVAAVRCKQRFWDVALT